MESAEPRYIIAGKDVKRGAPGSDSSNSKEYFELGWELTTTYLQLVYGRSTATFSRADVVVTASGREFLYKTSFANVIAYADFSRLPHDASRIVDLVNWTNELYFGDTWQRKLRLRRLYLKWFHFWRYRVCYRRGMKALPMELPSSATLCTDDPFFCICIRIRDHQPQRNLPREYLHSLLDALSGKSCFLVGHGSEEFVRHSRHRVCSLAEFAALVRHSGCAAVIGTMTGPIQLAQMIHRNRLVVIDLDDHYRLWGHLFPSVLSDLCNFPRVRHSVYNYRPSVIQLLEDLSTPSPASRVTPESYRQNPRFFDAEARNGHAFFERDRAAPLVVSSRISS